MSFKHANRLLHETIKSFGECFLNPRPAGATGADEAPDDDPRQRGYHQPAERRRVLAGVEIFRLRDGARRVAFSPDGKLLAGVLQELSTPFVGALAVRVWTLDPERLLRIARERVTRALTEAECQRYLLYPTPAPIAAGPRSSSLNDRVALKGPACS